MSMWLKGEGGREGGREGGITHMQGCNHEKL